MKRKRQQGSGVFRVFGEFELAAQDKRKGQNSPPPSSGVFFAVFFSSFLSWVAVGCAAAGDQWTSSALSTSVGDNLGPVDRMRGPILLKELRGPVSGAGPVVEEARIAIFRLLPVAGLGVGFLGFGFLGIGFLALGFLALGILALGILGIVILAILILAIANLDIVNLHVVIVILAIFNTAIFNLVIVILGVGFPIVFFELLPEVQMLAVNIIRLRLHDALVVIDPRVSEVAEVSAPGASG